MPSGGTKATENPAQVEVVEGEQGIPEPAGLQVKEAGHSVTRCMALESTDADSSPDLALASLCELLSLRCFLCWRGAGVVPLSTPAVIQGIIQYSLCKMSCSSQESYMSFEESK